MGKYKTLVQNSVFVLIGNIGGKAIGFLMLPFYTSYLSVSDYGAAELVAVYVSLLMPFFTCSIYNSILVYPVNCDDKSKTSYFSSGLVFTALMFFLTAVIFELLDYVLSADNTLINYKWMIYANIVVVFLQSYFQQFCMALNKMFVFSFSGIVLTISIALFGVVMIPKYGLNGYIFSLISANFITALFTFSISKIYKYISISTIDVDKIREMLTFSIPLIPNALMWWIIGALNKVTMETYVGVYFIGLYAIADKIPGILSAMFNSLTNAWKVSVLNEYGKEGFSLFYNNIAKIVITSVALGVAILGFLSEPIIKLATQENFHVAWIYSPIMAFGFLFQSIGGVVDTIFSAEKKGTFFLYTSIIGATACIVFNFLLIPYFGIWGAICSFVFSHFSMSMSRWLLSEKFVAINDKIYIWAFVFMVIVCNVVHVLVRNYTISSFLLLSCLFFYTRLNKDKISVMYGIIKLKKNE